MKNWKKRILSAFTAVTAAISAMMPAGGLGIPAGAENTNTAIIVSLGDSYSAGEGIEPFYGQGDVGSPDFLAHRSENSWGGKLTLAAEGVTGTMKDHRDTNWFFAASSGAEIKHFSGKQTKNYNFDGKTGSMDLAPQFDVFSQIPKGQDTDFVTMTIGGNDVGFVEIMFTAIISTADDLSDKVKEKLDDFDKNIRAKLKTAYQATAETAGEQAVIIVAGYPHLMNPNGFYITQGTTKLEISAEKTVIVNNAVDELNKRISLLVDECYNDGMNIVFTNVDFKGHEAYSDDPWINEVYFSAQKYDIDQNSPLSGYSLHPNDKGTTAYAASVQSVIDACPLRNITLDPNGGTVDTVSKSVRYSAHIGTLPTPTREGYKFDGWFTAAEGGDKIESSNVMNSAQDVTLYAHWSEDPYGDAIKVDSANFASTLEGLTGESATLALTEDVNVTKVKFPKNVKDITIIGFGHRLTFAGSAAIKPNQKLTLNDITIEAEKKGVPQAITVTGAAGGLVLSKVTFSGKKTTVNSSKGDLTVGFLYGSAITIKGNAKTVLYISDEVTAETITGFGKADLAGALGISKTFKVNDLDISENARLVAGEGSAITVSRELSGNGEIYLDEGFKPITLGGKVSGRIRLNSKTKLKEGDQVFKSKADNLNEVFDVTDIAPDADGTEYGYGLYVKSGKAFLRAFRMKLGSVEYCEWGDILDYIKKQNAASAEYTVELLGDADLGKTFKLPAKGKYASLTIMGNDHTLSFSASSITLTGGLTLKNITFKSTANKACTIKTDKFELKTDKATFVNCIVPEDTIMIV